MAQVVEVQVTPPRQAVVPSQSMAQDAEALHRTPISQALAPWQRTSQEVPAHRTGAFRQALASRQRIVHPAAWEQSTPIWQALLPPLSQVMSQ